MQERIADRQAEGMRLDKYLRKLLPQAPDSFLYRMLRKKNIVVNDQKAAGSLLIHEGDRIRLYLSDETISSFSAGEEQHRQSSETVREAETAYRTLKGVRHWKRRRMSYFCTRAPAFCPRRQIRQSCPPMSGSSDTFWHREKSVRTLFRISGPPSATAWTGAPTEF